MLKIIRDKWDENKNKLQETLIKGTTFNRVKPRLKYIPAKLIKEFKYFYLFQTKNYMTTIHKRDMNLIREAV